MFGSVVLFAFMFGLEKDSLEKGEMTIAEIKREQRKILRFRTSLILSMLGSITLVTVKALLSYHSQPMLNCALWSELELHFSYFLMFYRRCS